MARASRGRLVLIVVPLVVVCACFLGAVATGMASLLTGPKPCQTPADQEQVIAAWLSDPVMNPQLYGVQPGLLTTPPTPGVSRYCDPTVVRPAHVQPGHVMAVSTEWQIVDDGGWSPLSVLFDRVEPLLTARGWAYAGYSETYANPSDPATAIDVSFCRNVETTATVAHVSFYPHGAEPPQMGSTLRVSLERTADGLTCPAPAALSGDGVLGQTAYPAPEQSAAGYPSDFGPVPYRWWFRAPAPVRDTATTAQGMVYVATDSPDVDNAVFALDGLSGTTRWRTTVPGRVEGQVAVGDGQVYIGSLLGWVVSLDAATGAQRWRTLVPYSRTTVFRGQAPVVGAGLVFIGGADGRLYALDGASGSIRWRSDPGLSLIDSSPPAVIGSTVFTVGVDHHVYALDTATGAIRWNRPTPGASAVVAAGPVLCVVLAQSGVAGDYRNIFAYGDVIQAVDPTTGAEIWQASGQVVIPAATVPGGLLALGDGTVAAVNRATGAIMWQVEPADNFHNLGKPARQIIVQSLEWLFGLNANTGATIWVASNNLPSSGQPVAADGVVVSTSEILIGRNYEEVGIVFAFADPGSP